ncbi:ribosomal protein S18-alanine N-acetyltransferase [Microbacteriaceae bacterium VKM Ac-2855]|nr:ribosomal protein S18-alanine N-acetyltransferase [Microbacteriaceae bacterium VKM Ac-2855]
MTAWELRRAVIGDLAQLMRIEHDVYPSDAWSKETMAAELRAPHGYYVVAHPVGEPSIIDGYAGLLAPRGAGQADVQTMTVAAHARRRGLGRTLLTTVLNEARRRGAEEVFLEVRADNPNAQALYESAGFVTIGVRRGYYQPDDVDGITMKLELAAPTTILAEES